MSERMFGKFNDVRLRRCSWFGLLFIISLLFSPQLPAQSFNIPVPGGGPPAGTELLFGLWGTAEQCDAHATDRVSNPALAPISIDDQWLSQGGLYCYLQWTGVSRGEAGLRVHANTLCGEDAVRDYRLIFNLADDGLRIIWSLSYASGPMQRCDV